jgi:hypothetical protein
MQLRFKDRPVSVFTADTFNILALDEVLTGDGSAYCHDLEAWIEARQEWKCLAKALHDHDVIPDDYHVCFREPRTDAERQQGYY